MVQEIKKDNHLYALIIDHEGVEDGTHPLTNPAWGLQALMMKREAGHEFDKHTHEILERSSRVLQEVVVVTKGALKMTLCDRDGNDIGEYNVSVGQAFFVVDGGVGIEVLDDAEFFEFKNGPHTDDKILL